MSLNALISAYSASPSLTGSGSNVPMHPRSLGARPGREERVFHVTNRGLHSSRLNWREREGQSKGISDRRPTRRVRVWRPKRSSAGRNVLVVVRERRDDGLSRSQSTVQSVERMETVFLRAGLFLLLYELGIAHGGRRLRLAARVYRIKIWRGLDLSKTGHGSSKRRKRGGSGWVLLLAAECVGSRRRMQDGISWADSSLEAGPERDRHHEW